ncbi:MAG TPA: hypothetical protein VHO67_08025 [Polyangia bacterium]|nr:hypothetical protein [Polyangia bacterium]
MKWTAWLRDPRIWSLAAAIAIPLVFMAPMIVFCPSGGACQASLNRIGATDDWRHFATLWEAARVALRVFHQFPSWNPYHCGGIVLFQEPEAPFPGPLFLLTFFWLPAAVGMKVWIFVHLLAATLGARALVADEGGGASEQILGAALVAACGFFAEHIGGGHLSFTPFLYLPAIVWAFRRALAAPPADFRHAVVAAALLATTVLEGGTYPAPLMAVALAAETLARLGARAERRALLRTVPVILLLAALLSAVRLLPVLAFLREHPRPEPIDDFLHISEVFAFWTTREHGRGMPGHRYVWPEYDDYVGFVPVALMLVGAGLAVFGRRDPARRVRRIDLAVLVVLVWCALGGNRGASLFQLLHALPVFDSLRVPSRFLGPAMVAFALLAASALGVGRRWVAARWPALATAATVGAAAIALGVARDVTLTNRRLLQQGIDPPLPDGAARTDFFQNPGAAYWRLPAFPVEGYGTPGCYVALDWKASPWLWLGHSPQTFVQPLAAGTVTPASWTPNRLEYDIRLNAPATVVVNQNYDTGWRVDGGQGAFAGSFVPGEARLSHDVHAHGLLAVDLPAGAHHLVLRHRPPGLWLGAFLTTVGMLLSVAGLRRRRAKLLS